MNSSGEATEVVDVVFAIRCERLPVDHAWALSEAVRVALPWIDDEPLAGVHTVHGAASGAGWQRPEGDAAQLQLSRRARLALRLPRTRLAGAAALSGRTLSIAGNAMHVGALAERPLVRIANLFARGVVFEDASDEAAFIAAAHAALDALGVVPAEVLCGRMTPLATPGRTHATRSLMLAGLKHSQSITLQRHGLGIGRRFGCGLFIPHKAIGDLRGRPEDDD